ncbi:MAG: hypothetical protein HN349_08345 [Gammaproteobacteria bacterium]|jgi:hypothetical protein|nr:hypothetical protein [Gammaproteobacteria bacterium]MBT4196989.1 hypothetical protein [Gammaproteobacteria bacterium]
MEFLVLIDRVIKLTYFNLIPAIALGVGFHGISSGRSRYFILAREYSFNQHEVTNAEN